jgi:maltose O-acetyltransferase
MPTEKQKMLAGEPYHALDAELVRERLRARRLLQALNASDPGDRAQRVALIRQLIPGAAASAWIEPPFHCDYGLHLTLGDDAFLNFNCVVLDVAPIRIGARVLVGPAVQFYAATHPLDAATRAAGLELGRGIEVGDDAWIGGGSIVCPGVRIGDRCVIGAGSVVTRDIPAGMVAAGNPCRVLRPVPSDAGA